MKRQPKIIQYKDVYILRWKKRKNVNKYLLMGNNDLDNYLVVTHILETKKIKGSNFILRRKFKFKNKIYYFYIEQYYISQETINMLITLKSSL